MVDPLNDNEKEEMKALQDERKATEGHITDSQRARLSELQGRETAAKEEAKAEKKGGGGGGTETTTTSTTKTESKSPAGNK